MSGGHIVFEYLYRDAGNYKAWGSLLLSGSLSATEEAAFRLSLDSGAFFDADRVKVPKLDRELWSLSNGPTDDDHGFHEFSEFRAAKDSDIANLPVWEDAKTFVQRFKNIDA